jgi:hypothetical protein
MGFATRGWYAAGRTAVSAHPEPCVRGLAEWGRETWRTGTDRLVPLFRPTKFAFASSVTVQLILAAKRAFPISTNCLSAVRVVGLLNNPRMEPERRAMCSRLGAAYPSGISVAIRYLPARCPFCH